MNFTVNTISKSLATYLKPLLPNITFLQNPTQQNEDNLPCMFLQQRYSNIELQTGGYYYRKIGLDLTYLENYNLVNLQELYQQVAEFLDLNMECFPYSDGENAEKTMIRTYNREWRIDLDALHYKFEIRERVVYPLKKQKCKPSKN